MINFNTTSYHLLGASEVPGRMLLRALCLWLKFNPHTALGVMLYGPFVQSRKQRFRTKSDLGRCGLDIHWTPPGLQFHSSLR